MRSILIIGASSGIGAATALHLDQLGMQVFAGLEPADQGEDALAGASSRLRRVTLDVTSDRSIAATRYVVDAGGRLATALRPLIPDRIADRLAERASS